MSGWPEEVEARLDEPLAGWTTFGVGGPAERLALPRRLEEIQAVLAWAKEAGRPWTVLGGGSNLLVADQGVEGVVIALGDNFNRLLRRPARPGRLALAAQAGVRLARLVALAVREGAADLAFLAGIPGRVGGAVVMNAGAAGGAMEQVVTGLTLLDEAGRVSHRGRGELSFAYRRLDLPAGQVVVEAELESRLDQPATVRGRVRDLVAARRPRQPRQPSAGSFFRNPPGDFAGRLIEAAGLKGFRVGQAQVSEVHANFIVNLGGATAAEVLALAQAVRDKVQAQFGVELEPEVRFLGKGGTPWPWTRS